MTLYLDSAAIVRLYLDADGADTVRSRAAAATSIATVRTAFIEVAAGLGVAERDGGVPPQARTAAQAAFREDWPRYVVVAVTQGIVEASAELCERYDLRPSEAVHVAAARALAARMPYPVTFLSMDPRVMAVAQAEGLVADGPDGASSRPVPMLRMPWAQTLLPEGPAPE